MLRSTDKILAPGRVDPQAFIAWIERMGATGPYKGWVHAVKRQCDAIGMDRAIIYFQAQWECQFQGSYWESGNSGGMGIDADGWPTPFSIDPTAGEDAAMVHVATMWAMLGHTTYPKAIERARTTLAPTWLAQVEHMVTDPNRPTVRALNDLNTHFHSIYTGNDEATWAWDDQYVVGICTRANMSGIQIPDQALMQPVHAFLKPRAFHTVAGAIVRKYPTTTAVVEAKPKANSRFWAQGWRDGENVHGGDRWLVLAGAHQWCVHESGVKEQF